MIWNWIFRVRLWSISRKIGSWVFTFTLSVVLFTVSTVAIIFFTSGKQARQQLIFLEQKSVGSGVGGTTAGCWTLRVSSLFFGGKNYAGAIISSFRRLGEDALRQSEQHNAELNSKKHQQEGSKQDLVVVDNFVSRDEQSWASWRHEKRWGKTKDYEIHGKACIWWGKRRERSNKKESKEARKQASQRWQRRKQATKHPSKNRQQQLNNKHASLQQDTSLEIQLFNNIAFDKLFIGVHCTVVYTRFTTEPRCI